MNTSEITSADDVIAQAMRAAHAQAGAAAAVADDEYDNLFPPLDTPVEMVLTNWANPDYDAILRERMRRLNNIRSSADPEAIWAGLYQFYASKPADFIADWGMTTDPRNPEIGLPTNVPFILFKRQRECIEWLHERWLNREDGLIEKSRDMGVSWLCVAFGVWMNIFHAGTVVGYGSRKEEYVDKIGDPKSLFWKIRKFIDFLPDELKPGWKAGGWNERKDSPSMRAINRANESAMIGEAGDNIGRGNRTSIYFKDESAHYERPEAIDMALSATSNCKIDVSSVNGAGNPFYKKRHGGNIAVFIFDWRQDPRKSVEWYEKQKRTMDATALAQEVDRNYEASVQNAFIPADIVNDAMRRGPADVRARGGLRVGVDVARFGNDKTSIVFRRGRVMLKKVQLAKQDVMQVASRVRAEINAYGEMPEQIAVDTIGIGAGVADILRGWYPDTEDQRTGRMVQIVADVNSSEQLDDGMHYNLRAFMWSEMRNWLKGASICNDQDLKVDLTALRYSYRAGELLLESKDDAKKRGVKSPDDGDALALTFAKPTYHVVQSKPKGVAVFQPTDPGMGM